MISSRYLVRIFRIKGAVILRLLLAGLCSAGLSRAAEVPDYDDDELSRYFIFQDFGEWSEPAPGMSIRTLQFKRERAMANISVIVIKLDLRKYSLELLRAQEYGAKTLKLPDLRRRGGAIGAINASFFDPQGKPLGYLRDDGIDIQHEVTNSSLLTGFFAMEGGKPAIMHRTRFKKAKTELAFQAGPRILEDGKEVSGLRTPLRPDRRTGIGIIDSQTVILFTTRVGLFFEMITLPEGDGLSFRELALLFGKNGKDLGVQCTDVLNLDGGSSSALSLDHKRAKVEVTGFAPVPVALGWHIRD